MYTLAATTSKNGKSGENVRLEERSLVINIDNLPNCDTMDAKDLVNRDRSSIWTKHCYGEDLSIRVAGREGGYHSSPHIHDSEQLNFCADGEMWIYVENDGYHLRKGDSDASAAQRGSLGVEPFGQAVRAV